MSARLGALLALSLLTVACQGASPSTVSTLAALNDSGVTGKVTLTAIDDDHTRVDIEVTAGGHHDMPAHIHPGTCAELVPQPRYPLQSVQSGRSSTVIAAPLADLTGGDLAVNLHHSNENLAHSTACIELR
jgi:hypothetical protein